MSGVNFDSIPDELKAIPSWVLWRLEPGKKRKLEKHPYSIAGKMASCSNPKTWSDFPSVVKEFKKGGYTGIGFQLSSDNEIVCIDLDDKENTGKMETFLKLSREFNSFTEVSHSGLGLHIWCLGKKPGSKCRREDFEIYEKDRFIAVTGNQVEGSPNTINGAQEAINKFYEVVSNDKPDVKESYPQIATEGEEDVSLPEVMRRCRTNPKFERLYNGDISGYPSASEAVLALSNIVSWASIRDPQMIDLIVRQSNLYTEDWDRTKQYTIPKALEIKDVYDPGKAEPHHPNEITPEELKAHDDRISINDLKFSINVPPDHFISKYVAHMVDKTDAYPDYHYAAALTLLSIAADRRVYTHIKNTGHIYSNLWLMCLGQSSFSRKSTALNTVKIIAGANSEFSSCPGMFSTEGLIEAFSDNPRAYLIKDECAQILGSINKKQYMSDVRDVLCELYDCGDIKRKLRTSKKNDRSEYEITDSYPVFLMATTPDNFFMNTTRLDLTSGWLIRFLYVFPRYKKNIKGLELGTEQDKLNLAEIGTAFNHIAGNVSAFESVHIHPSEEALSRFNAWFIKKQERLESSEEDNSLTSTVFARILITALKIAALLTLGDSRCKDQFKDNGVDFSSKIQDIEQNENPNIEILIPDEFMTESMRLVDEYFLPMASDVIEDLISREDENIQGRILQFLKNSPKRRLTRSELLRKVKLTSKVFDEHIHTLVYDREEIAETVINESGKPKVLYLLKKGKELNKSLFEFN